MKLSSFWHGKQQFRAALCGHKAVEAGAACLLLMVQGQLAAVTLVHVEIATKTGLLAVFPAVALTFTRYARHLANRWTSSAFFAVCTFAADASIHASHYPGEYTEAAMTAVGAFLFSVAVSYTPVGKKIDELSEHFLHADTAPE
ncbi:MAG TPA: hypothetical protein VHC90_25705 [Bryobacteraceae bacterium]|nr:hypothetical protein [Bryobacteraceae bacterium]